MLSLTSYLRLEDVGLFEYEEQALHYRARPNQMQGQGPPLANTDFFFGGAELFFAAAGGTELSRYLILVQPESSAPPFSRPTLVGR